MQLASGQIIIADQFNNRIMIINPKILFQYGTINVTGAGPDQLNGPYTAYVIGDYHCNYHPYMRATIVVA